MPSGLRLVGLSFVFQQDNDPTPPGCVRAIWPRRRVMGCCIRWLGLPNHPTSTQLRWFGMSWTAEWRKSSQQVLSICGNFFKTAGKAFQVKLVEKLPRVCKAVKAKSGYCPLKNLKYILVTTGFHMCYFIVVQCRIFFVFLKRKTLKWVGVSKRLAIYYLSIWEVTLVGVFYPLLH